MPYTQKQIDRFWSNVQIGKPGECWLWKRSTHVQGYGQVGVRINGVDRVLKAHKVAWEINRRKLIHHGARASHTCGNPLCCNPHHVIVTTPSATKKAAKEAGAVITQVRGEKHGRAKLTEKQARLIKYKLNMLSVREVSEAFSLSRSAVWDLRHGITWRHI